MTLGNNNEIHYATTNFQTGQSLDQRGTYKLSASTLTVNINDQTFVFTITWLTTNKVILSSLGMDFIYAKLGSPDDKFLENYFAKQNSINTYSAPSQPTYEVCPACLGLGSCRVCPGTGTYSAYGYSQVCSACEGTGKCWRCKGTGKK